MKSPVQALLAVVTPAACALLAAGCSSVISTQTYLQDASVTAPVGQLPVHLAWDARPGTITVTPTLAVGRKELLNGQAEKHSNVNANGLYAVDTIRHGDGSVELAPGANPFSYAGSNLHWTTSPVVAGLSLDFPLSRSFALSGGLTYAGEADAGGLWGGYLAIGLLSEGPVIGMRVETGFQMTPVAYDVNTVVETTYEPAFSRSQYTRTSFFHDQDQTAPVGWFAGMTLNTRVPEWPLQPFVNLTLTHQDFFSFEPSAPARLSLRVDQQSTGDAHTSASATVVLVSPGLAVSLGPAQRILLGARMAFIPGWANAESITMPDARPVVAPFVQIDLGL